MSKLVNAKLMNTAPPIPEMMVGSTIVWMGHQIKEKLDFPRHSTEIGYVVTKRGCNVIPGAAWFRSIGEAKKGIAAWVLTCKLAPKDRILPDLENGDSDIFWMLMELTK